MIDQPVDSGDPGSPDGRGGAQHAKCGTCGFASPGGFRFCGQCGAMLAPANTATHAGDHAERRQLTILFCDLVGSTRLSHRMDAEDYHALLMAYRRVCIRLIEHYGGSEVRHIGDGTQAYFGYPMAQEDAAERAVLTALDVIDGIRTLAKTARWADTEVAVRIGIGSGTVITDRGSLPDGTGNEVAEALGETPNLAARIQSVAPVNSVVVGPLTRQLLGNLFTLTDRGEHDFKGIDQPVRVWRVEGVATLDRFEATRASDAKLVNRVRELPVLLQSWEEAGSGQGRVVVLTGEGGIGKSRMARALHDRIARQDSAATLVLQCSPIYSNTALYPITAFVESHAGLRQTDNARDKRRELRRFLERFPVQVDRLLPLFAALLTIDKTGAQDVAVDWRELRRQLSDALIEHLRMLSAERSILIVFEDVQWIDPSSRELLDRTVRAIHDCRVMIVVVCRPDVLQPWFGLSHVTVLPLENFVRDDTAALARHFVGGRELPMEVMAEIVERTGGVPLFVEEIVKTLSASGVLTLEGDICTLTGPLPLRAIPPTLKDSLRARLDQLGADRRYAQFGAVIGRAFSVQLLAFATRETLATINGAIDALVAAGILSQRDDGLEKLYGFSHALMREAALESLLRSQQQRMHAAVAEVLETHFPATGEANPELLARHYTEAGMQVDAIDYWLLAGKKASTRSETLEAISHLRRGLALIPPEERDTTLMSKQLSLLIALGPALITHIGPGAAEVREIYRNALSLCADLPESADHFAAHWGWWRISRNFVDKATTANTLLALAERLNDPGLALEAHHALWATRFVLGEQAHSLTHIKNGLNLYREGDYREHASTYGGHDAEVCGEGEAALVLWLTGHASDALARIDKALSLAEHLKHAGSLAHAMDYALMLHFYRRDVATVRRQANAQIRLASEKHFGDYEVRAEVFLGWALGIDGDSDTGLQTIRKGMLAQQSTGTTEDFPIFFAMQAEVHLRHGQLAEADAILTEARNYAEEQQVKVWDAELCRLQALVARENKIDLPSAVRSASAHLQEAFRIARRQGAAMLEYKCTETTISLLAEPSVDATTRHTTLAATMHDTLQSGTVGPADSARRQHAKELLVDRTTATTRA